MMYNRHQLCVIIGQKFPNKLSLERSVLPPFHLSVGPGPGKALGLRLIVGAQTIMVSWNLMESNAECGKSICELASSCCFLGKKMTIPGMPSIICWFFAFNMSLDRITTDDLRYLWFISSPRRGAQRLRSFRVALRCEWQGGTLLA